MAKGQSEKRSGEKDYWTVWQDDKSSSWRLSCSFCEKKIETAIVVPTKAIRICFDCLADMVEAATKNQVPSAESGAGSVPDSVRELSRDDTPKKEV
jgi:hypothetical protein